MRHLISITAILLVSWLAGCSGGAIPPNGESDPLQTYLTGYLPFVEEVILPETIYAGEDFTVTLRLSAVLKPDLFEGADMRSLFAPVGLAPTTAPADGYLIDTWMHTSWLTNDGLNDDTIDITMPALPAGDWCIGVWQLQDRAKGGMEGEYEWMPSMGADRTGQEVVYYPITVIERPTE